ncbi:MAG: carbohydrate porin [Proteobacteria bacterium]|nr:carbohydrate porin [Pseudomonadota bacterium]
MHRAYLASLFLFVFGKFTPSLHAESATEGEPVEKNSHLSGDWGGHRSNLENKGLLIDAVYKGEIFNRLNGDKGKSQSYLANYDLIFNLDGEKSLGWKNAKFLAYILGNEGDDPNEDIGGVQGVSNIAAPSTWKLYQVWADIPLLSDSSDLMLLFGLYDVNSEFDSKKFGGVFINPTHGIGPDFSQSGDNGPSIFPTASLGLRLKAQVSDKITGQIAVLDGVPGDPANPQGTRFKHPQSDGYLTVMEWAWMDPAASQYKKFALGGWHYTSKTESLALNDDPENSPGTKANNQGVYALAEAMLWPEDKDSEQGLGAYVRWGQAAPDLNQTGQLIAAALHYTGPIAKRDSDILALGYGKTQNSQAYRRAAEAQGASAETGESIVELSYKAYLCPSTAIQLDLQHIMDPGTDPDQDDANLLGVRLEVRL